MDGRTVRTIEKCYASTTVSQLVLKRLSRLGLLFICSIEFSVNSANNAIARDFPLKYSKFTYNISAVHYRGPWTTKLQTVLTVVPVVA